MHELILGGQRSGKSRCAERRAQAWLATPDHSATLLVTALAGDGEMRDRIERHRLDRLARVPSLDVEEVPFDLADAIRLHSAPHRLVLVDCLTLWLTNLSMPLSGEPLDDPTRTAMREALGEAVARAAGPVLLVSNEIGLGVTPMSPEARRFVDELGHLHQALAARCDRVTLMVSGIEVPVKVAGNVPGTGHGQAAGG